jgi:positive regulator of sigma E activity
MSYGPEWIPAAVVVGAFIVLMVPAFALIGLAVLVLAALAALVALAGAVVASPFLLARTLRRRFAERRQPTGSPVLIVPAIPQADS